MLMLHRHKEKPWKNILCTSTLIVSEWQISVLMCIFSTISHVYHYNHEKHYLKIKSGKYFQIITTIK